jgi:hypothetical protein
MDYHDDVLLNVLMIWMVLTLQTDTLRFASAVAAVLESAFLYNTEI